LAADKDRVQIRMREVRDDRVVFEVTGLDQSELDQLAKLKSDSPRWGEILAVFVGKPGEGSGRPPMLGSHRLDKNVLVFEPRFAPVRGLSYVAVLDRSRIPQFDSRPRIEKLFTIAKEAKAPT